MIKVWLVPCCLSLSGIVLAVPYSVIDPTEGGVAVLSSRELLYTLILRIYELRKKTVDGQQGTQIPRYPAIHWAIFSGPLGVLFLQGRVFSMDCVHLIQDRRYQTVISAVRKCLV